MASPISGLRIKIKGIVQGVGFRPFIYNLATSNSILGWVRNTSAGVEIEVDGTLADLEIFESQIKTNPPPLAVIQSYFSESIPPQNFKEFKILTSQSIEGEFIPISADISTCPDCLRELFNPSDRRYRYPFINCTNCGPRFTIVRDIPYDRPFTTMVDFPLCQKCELEYHDPKNRRFHAQPIACPDCGPQVYFLVNGKQVSSGEMAIQTARAWLRAGKIIAIKGLGGYLLACDAQNSMAVRMLRERKKRSDKPFALMAYSMDQIHQHCLVSSGETELLTSIHRPIVLVEKKFESRVAFDCAPNLPTLGVMLPYTPLHYLLLEPAPGFPEILVMTSGNLSEEPIAFEDQDAMERLSGIADAFLFHNRPIHMRMDDAVTAISAAAPVIIRRARGYSPSPIGLPIHTPAILATGAELKNTFCLTKQDQAFVSHHIGDLENYETLISFEQAILHYQKLYRISPELIACDLHPDYLSTRYARDRAARENIPLVFVQHHHAHLSACLAENNLASTDKVIGLCFDGTGFGEDGAIWGGEILVGSYGHFVRSHHLEYTPLPGGDAAIRRPSRMALSWLHTLGFDWEPDLPPVKDLCFEERTILTSQIQNHINSPMTSSMGRLFDAVSALIGVRQVATYEGQAAIELESIADPNEIGTYRFQISGDEIKIGDLINDILQDWHKGVPKPIISGRFHNTIAHMSVEACKKIRQDAGISKVALSGGVWQNRTLTARTVYNLKAENFTVILHRKVPVNDGCISLGQAVVAAVKNH